MRHLKDFEFIEGVIRAGSIRKASEDMNITASALNRRINRFEDEFGYEIFERLPRGARRRRERRGPRAFPRGMISACRFRRDSYSIPF